MAAQNNADGGLTVTPRMRELYETPGFLATTKGGQELRDLYQLNSNKFNASRLSSFGLACYVGQLDEVGRMIVTGQAPPLNGTETPYRFSYATILVAGSQRIVYTPPGSGKFAETLNLLLSRGCPPDVPDICLYTALHHATMNHNSRPELARILLERGSNVNHLNKYGSSAISAALLSGHVGAVNILMEFGASLDIADADGFVPGNSFVNYGPQVTAAVTKWLRKRSGEQAPLDEKKCDFCGKKDDGNQLKLKACSACRSARYCSAACQRSHWKTHKKTCKAFMPSNTVTLKPSYDDLGGPVTPIADFRRRALGLPTGATPAHHMRSAHQPSAFPKSVIVKIQVPYVGDMSPEDQVRFASYASQSPMLVYTKKRDFVCQIKRPDDPAAYDRVAQIIREKGVGAAKGYFAAELKSADELVVKVGEVLAEQPF
ncbi:hypothetical protein DENSPDRAFT_63519 [Dentipellis sp. KUC8613]|nr:hypothetical protein DENSPDRAFT_63519 [Dentipellis sp. KUC8613]